MTTYHAPPDAVAHDLINRPTWSSPTVVREFEATGGAELDGWSDPGEQAAVTAIASTVRGVPVLDLGVGGGRTTTLLRLLSDDYVAIDYMPDMVQACRSRHPGTDVRLGDARDLDGIADASVGLVVFSYNGLDAVSHDDRRRALGEIARVLRPGGLLQFSTLNLDGPCYRATPWHPAGSHLVHTWTPMYRRAMRLLWWLRAPVQVPRARRNLARARAHEQRGDAWAVGALESYDFGLLVHYTTLAGVRDDLAAAGLGLELAFDAEHGAAVAPDDDLHDVRYFQLVARRLSQP
jgi:SAM-dependent methyltransferase